MNWQNVLSDIPIDKHVRLTSKSKTHKKAMISNEKYITNIMNMINIDIQHGMIHDCNKYIIFCFDCQGAILLSPSLYI